MGSWNVRNRRLRRAARGLGRVGRVRGDGVARPLLDGLGNEDEFRTDYDGGFIGMSFRFFDPEKKRWSIYWADTRRSARSIRPCSARSRATPASSRARTPSRAGPSSCASLVGRHDDDAPLGAGVLRRRRRDLGDELGDGLHAGRRPAMSVLERDRGRSGLRHISKLVAPRGAPHARATRSSSGTTSRPPRLRSRSRSGRSRDGTCGTASKSGALGALGRARVRDPASLRRELLLPPRLRPGGTTTSSGRRSGRRTATARSRSAPGRSRELIGRPSASGSSARSATSSRRGAGTSARRATRPRRGSTCAIRSRAASDQPSLAPSVRAPPGTGPRGRRIRAR